MLSTTRFASIPLQPKWKLSASRLASQRRHKLVRYLLIVTGVFILVQILSWVTAPASIRIQHDFRSKSQRQPDRQQAVKKEFLHAWTGYRDHSWMADGLMPLTGYRKTQFCSWSATLVDALDTLWIMDLRDEFQEAVNATMTIHFRDSAEACEVSLFESTIRYLGGMLGAYDLSHEPRLVTKLVEVGDMLLGAFATHNNMPCTHCHLASHNEAFIPGSNVIMADVGSLYLEFSRLSQITGDPKYQQTVDFVQDVFARTQNDSTIPGLWPEMVDASSVDTTEEDPDSPHFAKASGRFSLGALSDSSYEYLVKGHMMLGNVNSLCMRMWKGASLQIKDFMLFRAHIPDAPDRTTLFTGILSRMTGQTEIELESRTEHLGCFAGGMFAIASRLFDEPEDFEIGKQLAQGCVWAYEHSPVGIMPETFTLAPCSDLGDAQCSWNETAWREQRNACRNYGSCHEEELPQGWMTVNDQKYILRPEAIESVFIMWRMTGDEYWRDVGWKMFQSIIHHTRTPFGHSALTSVLHQSEVQIYEKGVPVTILQAEQSDDMESFWFAETLKYFYLLFSDVDLISLDEFVLNTEAHPLRLVDGLRGF